MNKYPCRCHFIPDVVFKEMKKEGIDVAQPSQTGLDKSMRTRRQGLMTFARMMPDVGNNERLVFDSQNTSSLRLNQVRKEGDNPSVDLDVNAVYDNGGIVRDYFKTVLGWDSIDNNSMDLVSNVHYLMKYNNAFWDGEQMIFGDGDGTNFKHFARALDVTAHELTHGVVQYTANLEYKNQSGALNEHFADVFGTAIKQHFLKQNEMTANWLIGESCLSGRFAGKAIRSMKSPNDATVVMMPQPDNMKIIYKGTSDNGGVHINSGIPNHAFYLAAMGIGTQNAAVLWFEALKILKSTAKFKDLYKALTKVAKTLVIAKKIPASTQVTLDAAFKKVGII
ncbi:MAG: M4 family metallopeptidase [Saprospiraceae bacterium]|nr:M4 family metallopeptidase [Saprospiraceae bacterium]